MCMGMCIRRGCAGTCVGFACVSGECAHMQCVCMHATWHVECICVHPCVRMVCARTQVGLGASMCGVCAHRQHGVCMHVCMVHATHTHTTLHVYGCVHGRVHA